MLILLPPSESKHSPARGKPLDLETLNSPELNPLRQRLLRALQELSATDPAAAIEALQLGPTQFDLVVQNTLLDRSPTAAASAVYTGVLYDALDFGSLAGSDLRRANRRLAVVSALFGLVRTTDRIPAYRLSGGSRLPAIGGLPGYWRDAVSAVVAGHNGLVVDMLSSPYAAMVNLPPDAVTVKVWQPGPAGQRTAASHFNKATKGELARVLATDARQPRSAAQVLRVVREAGWQADLEGSRLDVMMRE